MSKILNYFERNKYEYISLSDLIVFFGSVHNETFVHTIIFLFHIDIFENLNLFEIDENYKIVLCSSEKKEIIINSLSDIRKQLKNSEFVYKPFSNIVLNDKISLKSRELIVNFLFENIYICFNKKDLEKMPELQPFLLDRCNKDEQDTIVSSHDRDETIEQLQQRIAELEADLAKLQQAQQPNTSNPGDIQESTYKLIHAMKDMLLDTQISQSLFVDKDNPNAKQKPTQEMLAIYIENMNIKGLGERNIKGIFAKANRVKK